ncbi:MAG: hypothetical protein EOP02_32555 [Proteobacteria bacterium]|nr:MAG: hypothetical protein EOP02_32555 [Pseudomonadota bacterium]
MVVVAAWLLLPFLLSTVLTWWARRYALRRNLLDEPGERRSHDTATPRGGGIAIVACMLVAMAWLAISRPGYLLPMAALAVGLVLVAGIGWVDDHRPLSAWSRLVVQAVSGLILAFL